MDLMGALVDYNMVHIMVTEMEFGITYPGSLVTWTYFLFSFCVFWDKFDTVAQAGMEVTPPNHKHMLLMVPNCALSYRTEASGNLKEVEVLNSEEPPRH